MCEFVVFIGSTMYNFLNLVFLYFFLVSIIHQNVNICTFHVLWDYYLDHHVLGENLINSFILQHHKKYSMIINIHTVEGKNTVWGDRFLDALNPIFLCQIKCFVANCFHRNIFSEYNFYNSIFFSQVLHEKCKCLHSAE